MTTEELTEDLATLKRSVAELERKFSELQAKPTNQWRDREPIARTPEQLEAFDEMTAYGKYYRVTGRDAPLDWKPGDPLPEPEYPE